MSQLTTDFQSLPEEYQHVIRLSEETYRISVAPLQLLVGGWSGAVVYLVSVASNDSGRVEHCILKLDRNSKPVKSDEATRHNTVSNKSSPEFSRARIAELVFDRVEHEGAIAIFYRIAGQSLLKYRPLSNYGQQSQLKKIFTLTNTILLSEWNGNMAFEQAVHPQKALEKWLGFRLNAGGNIERFLRENCRVDPAIDGLLINGLVFPNPLLCARAPEPWGKARSIDVATGFIHGDLNTNNILVKFSENEKTLEGYYLIDFALFKEDMPLLYDQRYLEMSYLLQGMSPDSFAKCVRLLILMSEVDIPDPHKAPVEMSGASAVIASARSAFAGWVTANHPSLHDDLWGQYWLAGAAAGLAYCHKAGQPGEVRLAGLIFAAANLKRYAAIFNLPLPTNVELLYDENQAGFKKPGDLPRKDAQGQNLPSGTVTFLFSDIEGSAKLAQQYSEAMPALLARHHEILNQAITAHNGFTFDIVGDSFAAAFHNPIDALEAALDIQRALHREAWSPAPLKVRLGIHTGAAQLQDTPGSPRYSGYATLAVSQRIMSAGHGGQILLSRTVVDLIRDKLPAGAQLTDMGERRLKDIIRPVPLYQLSAPGLPSEFPPLTAAKAVNHNLPTQLTAFIGRDAELASLNALLSGNRNRLVTIMAPGGMGKTRLSLEAAAQAIEIFPQGIFFVALDRLSSADMVVQAVAEVLPISLSSNEDPKSRVVEYFHGKSALLVMDNFEHVLDGAAFIQDILKEAPAVQVLATSRAKLNLTGETVFSIEGLPVGESRPEKSSAIELFAQSARLAQPEFELNDVVLPAVTRICRLVDGMPLAIVLAAAWIDTLAVDEIAAEIESSIDLLETEKRDVPDRQRSVRAVIESSWSQIDEPGQNLLKRLSVFRGGFTRTAAQEAAGASLRGLSRLVDKALLRRDADTGRYSIHELLRQYAEEQLKFSSDEEQSAHESHAKYFADFMKTREAHLHDNRSKTALLEIGADIDNIRVAWDYWVNTQNAQRILEFVTGLWFFFEVRGSYVPAIQFFGDAVKKLTASEPDVVWARAQLQARQAWFTALVGLPQEGLGMVEESLQTLRQINAYEISVETLQCANMNAIFLNKVELVARICQQMLERAERSGDVWERGLALIWSGWLLFMRSQPEEGLQPAQEALAIFEKLAEPFGTAIVSGVILSAITKAIGDIGASKAYCLRGMQAAEEINYRRLLQRTYDGLGMATLLEHDFQQAQQFFIKSLQISQECGQTREILSSLLDIVGVYLTQSKLGDALGLIAIVLNHPASDQHSLKRPGLLRAEAEQLRAQVESQLEQSLYQSAWESGQKQRLADVVAQVLNSA